MSYRFDLRDASLSDSLQRIATGQIAAIRTSLSPPPTSEDAAGEPGMLPPEAVHGMRKSVKKLRALLRLFGAGLSEVQPAENVILRDAARALAHQRDAVVRLATFDKLTGADDSPALRAMRAHLVAEAAMPPEAPPLSLAELRTIFASLELRAGSWTLRGPGRRILTEGLSDTRSRARRAMRAARDDRSDEALHDWRKRAKDHWYQARLMAPVWPEVMRAIVIESGQLGEILGDHHDLAVLGSHIDALPEGVARPEARDLLFTRIREAQDGIEAMAFPLGARLFAGDPEEMAVLWVKWWKLWRAQVGTSGSDDRD